MNTQKGFIGEVVLIVLALVILGYFNIDIESIFKDTPVVKENILFFWDLVVTGFTIARDFIFSVLQ